MNNKDMFISSETLVASQEGSREGLTVYNVDLWGNYWSSSPDITTASYAYRMQFSSSSLNSAKNGERKNGFSVRLVYDVQ